MLIVGHRGSSLTAPENTLASFRQAWREGADAVELDIHASRDGQAVVIHDDTTDRTTGCRARVRDLTLAELQALDAGRWKDVSWQGERIPSLRDVLIDAPAGKKAFVELKSGPDAIDPLARLMDELRWDSARCVLVGFSLEALRLARERFPLCEILLNISFKRRGTPPLAKLLAMIEKAGLQGLGIGYGPRVDEAMFSLIRKAGHKIFVWTVNDGGQARLVYRWGADYLASDCPGRIRKALA